MSNKLQLHPKLTECKQCKSYNHSSTHHPTYKHCRVIQCSICGTHWYACIEHNKRFQNKLHSHFVNEHSFPYILHSKNSSNHSDNTTNIKFTMFNADDHVIDVVTNIGRVTEGWGVMQKTLPICPKFWFVCVWRYPVIYSHGGIKIENQ